MTSASTPTLATSPALDDPRHLRLSLKPRVPVTGRVDGGWWPRSRALAAEIPALVAALAVRLEAVESVSYNLDDWEPTARRVAVEGRLVRLAGYRTQHPDTIDVLGDRRRLTLLVVPPDHGPRAAHAALMAAGCRGNTDEIDALLLTLT
jgi:hypothetical protein